MATTAIGIGTPAPRIAPGPSVGPNGSEHTPPKRTVSRQPLFVFAGIALALILLGAWVRAGAFQSTDDAQIDGNISAIGSRVTGTVQSVRVVENQRVRAGDILAELDPTDLQVALAEARAQLALAEGEMEAERPNVSITATSNGASISRAENDVTSARADLDAARRDLDQWRARQHLAQLERARGESLLADDVIARAEFDQLTSGRDAADAAVAAAEQRVESQGARLTSATARLHELRANAPRELTSREASLQIREANVELARARLQQAELNASYARIIAPVSGIVGKKSVNVGDRIQAGQQLLFITQTSDVWVTAFYRETQIQGIRVGARVRVHVDATSRDYTGRVESLGGATGSRFSLLPPENASGNYVKIVQRLPVRIHLDRGQAGMDRLRPGMSVEPQVRVR